MGCRFLFCHIVLNPLEDPKGNNNNRDNLKSPEPHENYKDPFNGERTCFRNESDRKPHVAQSRNQFKNYLIEPERVMYTCREIIVATNIVRT